MMSPPGLSTTFKQRLTCKMFCDSRYFVNGRTKKITRITLVAMTTTAILCFDKDPTGKAYISKLGQCNYAKKAKPGNQLNNLHIVYALLRWGSYTVGSQCPLVGKSYNTCAIHNHSNYLKIKTIFQMKPFYGQCECTNLSEKMPSECD